MTSDQSEFDLRFEWCPRGIEMLAPVSDAVVIVDVLTFSTAVSVFEAARSRLPETMRACVSGKELIDWGYEDDVAVAVELNRDDVAPRLRDGAYMARHSRRGP